jgi:alanyl-tRNA synthetase
MITSSELRKKYIEFFQSKGHAVIPSASLIPENDPTTLFTGSGMQPMIPYLLGEPHPEGVRIADAQKCFRAQDIDEVGDNRHTTLFEMLGNWSLGDYFKKEQIGWVFAFLTQELGLDPQRLYITVFRGNDQLGIPKDEETVRYWKEAFSLVGMRDVKDIDFSERDGMQDGRIFYYDDRKNWWSRVGLPDNMPEGEPGGPDSEMFWDFGVERGLHEASDYRDTPCHVNCDCGRFMEIGNSVFMQYKKKGAGFEELPAANVDFGGGLERLLAAARDEIDIFRLDFFDDARKHLERLTERAYGIDTEETYAFRVILDHIRAATFIIGDEYGIVPSNTDQGYVVRRLIRRAVRFGRVLGIEKPFCADVAKATTDQYSDEYPELKKNAAFIFETLRAEEKKFKNTLSKGLKEFEKMYARHANISGKDAFVLYSTYGFPLELSQELAEEKGQEIDEDIFRAEFKKHQDLSRAGAKQKFHGGLADHTWPVIRQHTATHLLQQALRDVLGDHVLQRGSNITKDRLRFDFSHPKKLTDEEIRQVEEILNKKIEEDMPVRFDMLTVDEAKKTGAIGLFDEKYAELGNKVKVYSMGDYSKEYCGGPHVEHTAQVGGVKIVKEEAVAEGVRRIKAVLIDPDLPEGSPVV